ncbi:MAG TPA: decaprenyl-phosphate phosphoribosyltransferase [Candidatus Kapabacteria bacterium]|nr:decaprenyl-phosphate phosphoribosyltransferase [Candidatus Kapabacteria bacterium]
MPSIVRLLRPKQWVKNFFVFGALLFSRQIFSGVGVVQAIEAFFAFCFLSSAVYILNDILDRESDANHPQKKHRPIASGKISVSNALLICLVCLVIAAALASGLDYKVWIALAAYALINIGYSLSWKHVVLLDVFCIASGFMLRVMAGAWAINVEVSQWLILCTLFLSLLLAAGKRRSELRLKQENTGGKTRAVLDNYTVLITDQITTITAAGVVISYALYTVSDRTVKMFGTENLIYTTIFVLYGVFRYLYIEHKERAGENPTDVATSDIPMIVNILLWVSVTAVIIYAKI